VDHEQFEILVAAILTAGALGRQGEKPDPAALLAQTLENLRNAEIIVKKSANFIPKGGRGAS
jgi:hypothetical protein